MSLAPSCQLTFSLLRRPPSYPSQFCLTRRPSFIRTCSACALPMHGAFVRALGMVYHLQCFKCIVSTLVPLSPEPSLIVLIGSVPLSRPGFPPLPSLIARLAFMPPSDRLTTKLASLSYVELSFSPLLPHVGVGFHFAQGKRGVRPLRPKITVKPPVPYRKWVLSCPLRYGSRSD